MEPDAGQGGKQQSDRRVNAELRTVFDTAYTIIEPFLDPAAGWGGRSLEHLAYRVLRGNFENLSPDQVKAAIAAAHRVYITRHPESSGHLLRPEELKKQPFRPDS